MTRLQDPPWNGLAAELGKVTFLPTTDPVVRDYIIQHLGHLWEENGSSNQMDLVMGQAVGSSDETTANTALIALSKGYERDHHDDGLARVRHRVPELAKNPNTGLAVRVTAFFVAGEDKEKE